MPVPKFLSGRTVKIPVGGIFKPTGFVGPWKANVMSWFMTQENVESYDDVPSPDDSYQLSGYNHYYYFNYDACNEAYDALGGEYNPQAKWVFATSTADILSFASPEAQGKFGPRLISDLRVMTMKSKKYRHEMHMIALPAAVAAYAVVAEWDTPGFNLDELLVDPDEQIYGDDLYLSLCGDPDSGEYQDCTLWKRRVALWEALGEKDPHNHQLKGSGIRFATESDKLSEALGILHQEWDVPVWCRILPVYDPRVDAMSKQGKRLTIPTIADIYGDKAEAEAAAEKLRGSAQEAATETEASSSGPPIPAEWSGAEDYWKEQVVALKAECENKPWPLAKKMLEGRDLQAEFSATAEDFEAWWNKC